MSFTKFDISNMVVQWKVAILGKTTDFKVGCALVPDKGLMDATQKSLIYFNSTNERKFKREMECNLQALIKYVQGLQWFLPLHIHYSWTRSFTHIEKNLMEAFSVFFYGISLTDLGTNIAIHDKLKQHLSCFFDNNCY